MLGDSICGTWCEVGHDSAMHDGLLVRLTLHLPRPHVIRLVACGLVSGDAVTPFPPPLFSPSLHPLPTPLPTLLSAGL